MKDIRCIDCNKTPSELPEYVEAAEVEGITPESYVEREEGTYNTENGHFICTADFIKREMVLGRRLVGPDGCTWTAP